MILLLHLSEIFNIFGIRVFFFFFENSRKIFKKNFKPSQFLNCLTQQEITSKRTIVYGGLVQSDNLGTIVLTKLTLEKDAE